MDMSVSWRNHLITVALAFVCGILVGISFSLGPGVTPPSSPTPAPVQADPTPALTQVNVLDLEYQIVDPLAGAIVEGTP